MVVRFGIVGCGYIAHRHARHIQGQDDAELVGVFDIDDAKASSFSDSFGVPKFSSLEEFLNMEGMDMVVVCTPNGIHHETAIAALEAGKHVLVEKPMSIKKSFCEQMIAAAEKSNRLLFVVKQNRFNPPVQALKQLVDTGRLGKIYMVNVNCYWNRNEDYYKDSTWRGTKDLDGGSLFTQFSHFIDIFYYLFGDIREVKGISRNAGHKDLIEFEDTGCFHFEFNTGAIGSFTFTTAAYEKNMEGSIAVFAENGTVKIGGKYLNTIDYQSTNGFDIENLPVSGPANDYGHYEGSMSNHDKIIRNVVQTLNGHEQIMTNAYEGMKVVEIIEKFYTCEASG